MKRDWDLIRKLMVEIEEYPHFHIDMPFNHETAADKLAYASEIVDYHVTLLADAGLLLAPKRESAPARIGGIRRWRADVVLGLSWAGHEFLDTVRDDTIWEKTKKQLIGKGAELSFELIKQTALFFIKQHLSLP